jgi:hypothetical protein
VRNNGVYKKVSSGTNLIIWTFNNQNLLIPEEKIKPPSSGVPFIARIIWDNIKDQESIKKIGAVVELKTHPNDKNQIAFVMIDSIGKIESGFIPKANILTFDVLLEKDKLLKKFTLNGILRKKE